MLTGKAFRCSESLQVTPLAGPSAEWLLDGVEVVTTQLVAEPDVVRGLLTTLSPDERRRASSYVFGRDRCRFIVARARLRQLLGDRLNVRPEAVGFAYGPHGKPALARPFADSGLRFNVSHCRDMALYALASGRELGVDVEAIGLIPDADDIATRYFSRREYAAYQALGALDRPLAFVRCWTCKEAVVKALGEGLSRPLHCFDVSRALDLAATTLRVGGTPSDQRAWCVQSFTPAPGFVAAVATEERGREALT